MEMHSLNHQPAALVQVLDMYVHDFVHVCGHTHVHSCLYTTGVCDCLMYMYMYVHLLQVAKELQV